MEKCPECKKKYEPNILGNVHNKTWEWKCPDHGPFKIQFIIDGEVMREWKKKK